MQIDRKKILVIDDSESTKELIIQALSASQYHVKCHSSTSEYMQLIEQYVPDLIIFDLMLAKVGGISILRDIKQHVVWRKIGVIILTGRALQQDYQLALQVGANYYAIKPVTSEQIFELVDKYFSNMLHTVPPPDLERMNFTDEHYHLPKIDFESHNYLKFWGTRGSTAVSGSQFIRYGGSTSCLEIKTNNKNERIIIDAGTGIRALAGEILASEATTIHLFISHPHWDHIIGFPFFFPVYLSKYTIHIYSTSGFHKNIRALVAGMLEYDYFPVKLDDMQAQFHFHELTGDPVDFGEVKIHYTYTFHPGSSIGFKIETPRRMIGYVTDNEFLLGYHGNPSDISPSHPLFDSHKNMIEFFTGCQTLIHEAQYYPDEYFTKVGWGHCSISNASVLIKYCGAKFWIVTHHDYNHNDEMLDRKLQLHKAILADCQIDCQVKMAHDGLTLPL